MTSKIKLILGEYPVPAKNILAMQKMVCTLVLIACVFGLYTGVLSFFSNPTKFVTVYANSSYCPGELKANLKSRDNVILSCKSGSTDSNGIKVAPLSTVITFDNKHTVIAVLSDKKEVDPIVIAVSEDLVDSALLVDFVQSAMHVSDTDILNSGGLFWGMTSNKSDILLISNLLDLGVVNPIKMIDERVMFNAISQLPQAIDKPSSTIINDNSASKPIKTVIGLHPTIDLNETCSAMNLPMDVASEFKCQLIDIFDGNSGRIIMFFLIAGIIYYSVVMPNILFFGMNMFTLLVTANIKTILMSF